MKIQVLSDLHLEFYKFEPVENVADVVVIPGDISSDINSIKWMRETFPNKEIVYVLGNHEFYTHNYQERLNQLYKDTSIFNVHLLDRGCVIIDGIKFIGCTLWTDFKYSGEVNQFNNSQYAKIRMNDFRCIGYNENTFTPQDSIDLNKLDVEFLEKELSEITCKTVVVTHHLPSSKSVVDRFKNDKLTSAFASNLDYLLGGSDLWIHGHTHDSCDYVVGKTRVICNPRGYCTRHGDTENKTFNDNLIVEI